MDRGLKPSPVTVGQVFALAWPAAVSVLLNNAFKVIDQYAVQWLGVAAQAAVGACTFVLIALYALYSLVAAGAGPLAARATGARDDRWRRRVVGNGLTGSLLIGALTLAGLGLGSERIAALLGLAPAVRAQAAEYLFWLACAGLPLTLAPLIDSVFIAMGRTRLVMGLQVIATVLNAVLNPLFIYRLDLGIGGAALATGLSRGVAVALGLVWLVRLTGLRGGDLIPDNVLRWIVSIGAPVAWGTALYALAYWGLLAWVISPLGPAVNAALGIGYSALEGFTWPLFWGLAAAAASLTGRHLGAADLTRVRQTIRSAAWLALGFGTLSSLVFWFGAERLTALFSDDPEVHREAVLYARLLAFSQWCVAFEALAGGVLEGGGATRAAFWWSAPFNLLRIPLAGYLTFRLGWGSAGVWWAINLTTYVKAAGLWWQLWRVRWPRLRF
ncbi:hypothetical protein MIT9_P2459 [Methylomarinovum caldicuralii]|uniref:Multidrug-efflux transporter n=1 Tax=Methylomarinovum caldicuralii TaxID=438856 RepID=A0AAU9CSA3_9GAMM|nr:MATE family efflux transporter [Methylomarinovum caldicuralii]BCX82868.1 hypothetical protein MIT9_P2459 [Methylomarinovum caldicuralii]